jgi:hypothetical protein
MGSADSLQRLSLMRERHSPLAGNGRKGTDSVPCLNHQNIYGQLQRCFDLVFDFGAGHDRGFFRSFNQQVNVTAFALIIQSGAIKPNLRALTQHGLRSAFDGVNLGGGQAHGFCWGWSCHPTGRCFSAGTALAAGICAL